LEVQREDPWVAYAKFPRGKQEKPAREIPWLGRISEKVKRGYRGREMNHENITNASSKGGGNGKRD